eukprot:CAMPEP_0204560322 /NCGR_PEP_ID=MMETSP0661-20131031/32546_1 /ASSEMBLY_ACC=CAM_ASM_000606 /TAXON_ID=109239 /ORGANISM="Alexandrium margalefi, Strain AMGDE01CS-322" /LENGTH=282 /DNA_ID=CAMNT_0051567639 /DNA_START=23 /DNA_END=867 /DNA_ORIENTATION=+
MSYAMKKDGILYKRHQRAPRADRTAVRRGGASMAQTIMSASSHSHAAADCAGGAVALGGTSTLALNDELGEPTDGVAVTPALQHAAHEEAHRPARGARRRELQGAPEFRLPGRPAHVGLLAQHRDGGGRGRRPAQEPPEFLGRLGEARPVRGVHHEEHGVGDRKVVAPEAAPGLVAGQVEGPEADAVDDDVLRLRVECRLLRDDAVVLEHLEERGLPRIVEPEEQQARVDGVRGHVEEALLLHCRRWQGKLRLVVRGGHAKPRKQSGRSARLPQATPLVKEK